MLYAYFNVKVSEILHTSQEMSCEYTLLPGITFLSLDKDLFVK